MSNQSTNAFYSRAIAKWSNLHEQGKYSQLPRDSYVAIVHPVVYGTSDPSSDTNQDLLDYFQQEAELIQARYASIGRKATTIAGLTKSIFEELLTNPEYSSICLIGNGNFSSIYDDGSDGSLDWKLISNLSDHLKLGSFVQRTCGRFNAFRNFSPPLGTFCMADHREIYSPIDTYFGPESRPAHNRHNHERLIKRVSATAMIDVAQAAQRYAIEPQR